MTITTTGSNPTTVEAISNTTTTSPTNALQDINDSIVGIIDSGVTVDGFGLSFVSTFGVLPPPGATIQITNNGTVSTNQNSNHALSVNSGQPGNFGDFTYSGSGSISNTGSGGDALSITDPTGNIDITVSGTSTISGSDTGGGIEASCGTGTSTVKVTVQSGGTVEGETAVSFGGGVATLDNSGTVQGTGFLSSGVGGSVATVTNSATISGTTTGVGVDNVTLTNKTGATIETTGTTSAEAAVAAIAAVDALAGADITNQVGATIAATGPFGQVGVLVGQTGATGNATLHNAGTITGALDGVNTNTSGTTTITNTGSITAVSAGLIVSRSGIRVNTASIENDQNGTISGGIGIVFRSGNGASTVFNDGTITGTGATSTAIQFSIGSSGNTLTLGTDSVINGNVLGAGSDILQLGGTGSASFNESNIGAAAQYQGFTTFNKIDTSTWTLTGTGTNGWTVEQGTLQVDGTIGAATVQSGATLDGTGTTGALTVQSGGTLAPGDAPGTITTGNLDLETGSALAIEAGGTSPGAGGFDQVDVNGSVTLGGTLSFTLLNGFTPSVGQTFEIINNDGNDAVNGTFAGLAEGATFTQAGVTYSISYVGGTGNDVVLTVGNAPVVPDQPPVVMLGVTLAGYTENQAATAIAPAASVTDVDSPNFDGGSLMASGAGLPEDQLSILTDATVTVSGGVVSVGGNEIGTINATHNGVNGAALEIDFNSTNATPAAVTTLLDHIAYADNSDDPSTAPRTVTFTVNDGGSTANGGNPIGTASATFGVTAVNDAPTVSAPATVSSSPGTPVAISGITFGDVDSEGGQELATFNASSGTFTVTAAGMALGATGNGTSTVTLLNTIANLNAFIANGDLLLAAGPGTLFVAIDDLGHTGTGPVGGITTTTTANIVSGPALTAGAPVSGTEGSPTGTVKLATFTDSEITNPAVGNFSATINWGDGTAPTNGTVVAEGGGVFDVDGNHTYAEEGPFTISVSVNDGTNTGSTTDSATIADAALTASGKSITGTEGFALNNVEVASFTDANPGGAAGDFSATIDWGDGTHSNGTVVALAGGGFAVDGSHTYLDIRTFTTTVTINDDGGSHSQATGSATIGPFVPPNNPPPPPGTTADMITHRASTGDYEIYDLGNNSVLAAHPLTNIAAPWHVVGLGGFNGSDTTDMMLRNTSTGAFEIVDVSNNNASAPFQIGSVGLEWTVAGFGDFSSHPGETDMLLRNSNTGGFEVYDISNNAVTSAGALSGVNPGLSLLGFGDFSGKANETDMLMRNSSNGTLDLLDISNNQVTSSTNLGAIGLEWQFAGSGDFSGHAGETDLLMRNSNNGNFEVYDFSNVFGNTQITSATALGGVGLDWTVVGFGNLSGHANETDMVMRNSNTGQFNIYDISNNQVIGFHPMGQSGLEWTVDGIAADPPTSDAPSTGAPVAAGDLQGPFTASASGGWLTQMMQTSQSDTAAWLTQAMQATGAATNQPPSAGIVFGSSNPGPGPGFDTGGIPIAGTMPDSSLAIPNPSQTHAA